MRGKRSEDLSVELRVDSSIEGEELIGFIELRCLLFKLSFEICDEKVN